MQHLIKQAARHPRLNQYFQTIAALGLTDAERAEGYRRMVFNVLASNWVMITPRTCPSSWTRAGNGSCSWPTT